jgi:hypothetical protein
MRSGLVRNGVKWGFAGRGSYASPFLFFGGTSDIIFRFLRGSSGRSRTSPGERSKYNYLLTKDIDFLNYGLAPGIAAFGPPRMDQEHYLFRITARPPR